MTVFLVTHGSGTDGDEWYVKGIFSTRELAEQYIKEHNAHRPKWAELEEQIEEWPVDAMFDPKDYPNDKPKVQK
jgi:hypothetical protein